MGLISVRKEITRKILELLKLNVIGTPNLGMRYQHQKVEEKIYKIANPYFASIETRSALLGTCCFCKRTFTESDQTQTAFYIRYFSFKEAFRQQNVQRRVLAKDGKLRTDTKALLDGVGLEMENLPFYHYAYVDPRNERSLNLCTEFGFQKVREYSSLVFNRLFPKRREFEILTNKHYFLPELEKFYSNYSMFSLENLQDETPYFVIKDKNGEILAGAQAKVEHWKILELPGNNGKQKLELFSKIPLLNRIINKDYHFLALEGIYWKNGQEKKLEELFEGLLYYFQLNSCLLIADAESHVYQTLKSLDLGLVAKINKEVKGNVIVKSINQKEDFLEQLAQKPVYISITDVT